MRRINEKRGGLIVYSFADPELIVIDHIDVEPAHDGKETFNHSRMFNVFHLIITL